MQQNKIRNKEVPLQFSQTLIFLRSNHRVQLYIFCKYGQIHGCCLFVEKVKRVTIYPEDRTALQPTSFFLMMSSVPSRLLTLASTGQHLH